MGTLRSVEVICGGQLESARPFEREYHRRRAITVWDLDEVKHYLKDLALDWQRRQSANQRLALIGAVPLLLPGVDAVHCRGDSFHFLERSGLRRAYHVYETHFDWRTLLLIAPLVVREADWRFCHLVNSSVVRY